MNMNNPAIRVPRRSSWLRRRGELQVVDADGGRPVDEIKFRDVAEAPGLPVPNQLRACLSAAGPAIWGDRRADRCAARYHTNLRYICQINSTVPRLEGKVRRI